MTALLNTCVPVNWTLAVNHLILTLMSMLTPMWPTERSIAYAALHYRPMAQIGRTRLT